MKILIACGGSGGHIFPAIALAQGLKESGASSELLFVGSNAVLDKRIFEKEHFRYTLLSSNKLPYRISIKTFMFFIKLKLDIIKSLWILIKFSPDAVVGFGGYVSCPVIFAAYILRIPSVLHEQNVVPGRANRAMFRFVRKIAVSFKETIGYTGRWAFKTVFTGNPIRITDLKDDRAGSIKKLGLDPARFTVLVIGGSQGAHNLNKFFLEGLAGLEKGARSSLQVIHITGITDYDWASKIYKELGIEHRVFSFIDRIEEVYSASDLIVTRSGASAIFEIAYFGRPMVLVPYPFAMNHQAENAKFFSNHGAAVQIDEKDLSPALIRDKILKLADNKEKLSAMAESARRLSVPDSSHNLAEIVLSAAR